MSRKVATPVPNVGSSEWTQNAVTLTNKLIRGKSIDKTIDESFPTKEQ